MRTVSALMILVPKQPTNCHGDAFLFPFSFELAADAKRGMSCESGVVKIPLRKEDLMTSFASSDSHSHEADSETGNVIHVMWRPCQPLG